MARLDDRPALAQIHVSFQGFLAVARNDTRLLARGDAVATWQILTYHVVELEAARTMGKYPVLTCREQ
jgi:hypothetical protein